MKRIPTSLLSKTTNKAVDAHLIDGVTRDLLVKTELNWATSRIEGTKRIHGNGGDIPEHSHWNWINKSPKVNLLAYRCFGIECSDEMQGLMLVNTINHTSRFENKKGKPLIYVDYIEVAPWNLKVFTTTPSFGAIGIRLIEAAILFSQQEGFDGRVGLHSLPQSESFYEGTCYMTRGELDPLCEGLRWFELTSQNAKKFLGNKP